MFRLKYLQNYCTKRRLGVLKVNYSKTNFPFLKPEFEYERHYLEKCSEMVAYNTVLEQKSYKFGYKGNKTMFQKMGKEKERQLSANRVKPIPLALQYLNDTKETANQTETNPIIDEEKLGFITQFPLEFNSDIEVKDINVFHTEQSEEPAKIASDIVQKRSDMINWMSGYEIYDETEENDTIRDDSDSINYGTPDPSCAVSDTPCGGCGALLHCKDTAIPGYLPSQIYKNYFKSRDNNLSKLICQRCYFLKNYNVALQVRVPPETYPAILNQLSKHNNLMVLLMVDLLDFPCSIWPGIADLLGNRTNIFVVGNKIDLIPKDDRYYLKRIEKQLYDHVKLCGFATRNIRNVSLISAKTGYGIENLITQLQRLWLYRGHVYLVGCTNVGKSSLFNALLQSDYCKIRASDLIQRATISQWPGTTLNLLKFPIMRPSEDKILIRNQRLMQLKEIVKEEQRLRKTQLRNENTEKNATLMGHIGRSYINESTVENSQSDAFALAESKTGGFDENKGEYVLGKWCFDTPGVVQPDQIVHLLTVDELMLTLPKQLIRAETFCLKPGSTLFIAGLARLDYVNGDHSIRASVFRSNELPVTVCATKDADTVYENFLTSDFFKVPLNNGERLKKWPGLEKAKEFSVEGTSWDQSAQDVVLSSAGWVAINCEPEKEHSFVAWTPEKRGCYVRDCLLPFAVRLRGARLRFSPAYKAHRFI